MRTVATFLNPEEAKVARGFLSANGIEAIIAGEESLSVMPHIGIGSKAYQLMVDDNDENQARRLLAEVDAAQDPAEDPVISTVWTAKRIFLALALLASLFLLLVANGYANFADSNRLMRGPIKLDHGGCSLA